ncbi:pyridoxal phosphate-dependent aminotransferase [Engelhardtia mirabilis]|uniref:Aromatic-amino-acid aminotransferase n=1 Tax=Engelhardtia mirabilis TaxID=2528011 RepID=A0A518BQU5_9BACT|nr:Aromatic-amino-acid aminotransferase [Planctomycetes bacterium Pla133]QDV03670.1 Aromatic-amino-acid aminotransferase [Planctomycetes bacterium Pla86]
MDSAISTSSDHTLVPASSDRPGDDPIFRLNAMAQARAAAGEDVLNATLGALFTDDGQLAVMPSVYDAMRSIDGRRAAGYAPIRGQAEFLDAVVRDLTEGTTLAGQAIAVATPGGTGAVYNAIVNFLEPGNALLTSSFYWEPYGILAEHSGRRFATFRNFDESGAFDVAALEVEARRLIARQGRLLLVLNTPCHNPTGYSLDAGELERIGDLLLELSGEAPVTLLLDLAYEKFAAPHTASWQPLAERLVGRVQVLAAWTASKAFTQYGSRIGALAAFHSADATPETREHLANALGYTCRGTWSNCNNLGMLTVAKVLNDPELRARSIAERGELVALLDDRVQAFNREAAAAGLAYPRYEGGFFVSVFTDDPDGTVARAQDKGVFFVPLDGAVRLALCATPAVTIPRLVETLASSLEG